LGCICGCGGVIGCKYLNTKLKFGGKLNLGTDYLSFY
jgi:hypothetical protein